MSIQAAEREALLARLDTIMREVAAIRQALLAMTEPAIQPGNLTEQLLGCLGSEPIATYDFSLDWQRFAI